MHYLKKLIVCSLMLINPPLWCMENTALEFKKALNHTTVKPFKTLTICSDKQPISWLIGSPDSGTILARSAFDKDKTYIVNAKTGEILELSGHSGPVLLSPDSTILVVSAMLGTRAHAADVLPCLLDGIKEKPVKKLELEYSVISLSALNCKGTLTASVLQSSTIFVHSVETGEVIKTLKGSSAAINSLVFSPCEENVLLVAGCDKIAVLWDITKKAPVKRFTFKESPPVFLAFFSSDGKTILTASGGSSEESAYIINWWDVKTGEHRKQSQYDCGALFSLDGKFVLIRLSEEISLLQKLETGEIIKTLEGNCFDMVSVELSHDGTTVFTGSKDGEICFWKST